MTTIYDDCSKEELLQIVSEMQKDLNDSKKEMQRIINDLQPKMGRWIEHFDESGKWYECDQCHSDWGGPVNYCPNCGAKMAEIGDKEWQEKNGIISTIEEGDILISKLIDMIIDMGENEVKAQELPPSDLSDVIYSICVDIRHSVYLELKKRGIIKE